MKFKPGDLITGISKSGYGYTSDAIMEVVEYHNHHDIRLTVKIIYHNEYKDIVGDSFMYLKEDLFKHIPIINPLNKRLYPNYVEYKGYLVPPKTADKLKEQSK